MPDKTSIAALHRLAGDNPIVVNPQPDSVPAAGPYAPAPGTPANLKDGLRLFESSCASCHQWNGAGLQLQYAALLGARSVNDPSGRNVVQMILFGTRAQIAGAEVFMPSFLASFTDDEIAQLSNYVIYQFGGKQGKVTAAGVAKRRQD